MSNPSSEISTLINIEVLSSAVWVTLELPPCFAPKILFGDALFPLLLQFFDF